MYMNVVDSLPRLFTLINYDPVASFEFLLRICYIRCRYH
jgi:hypothetical protein